MFCCFFSRLMQFDSIRFDFDFLGCLFVCLFVCSIPWWSIIWLWIEISSWLICLVCQCSCFFFLKFHTTISHFRCCLLSSSSSSSLWPLHWKKTDENQLMIIIGQFEFVSIQINSIMMMMMMITTMIYKYKWMNKKPTLAHNWISISINIINCHWFIFVMKKIITTKWVPEKKIVDK